MKNIIVALLLSLTACSLQETPTPEPTLASQIELGVNTELSFQEGVKIKITKIEDSRCPENTTCVWAGMAKIYFTISANGVSKDSSIDYEAKPLKTTLDLGGQKFDIEVSNVLPYPKTTTEISQKDYKINITVKKA
ncbi:MAG: hypothetical protein ACOVO2_22540 [Emticicia sp.]|uniref:hypothetical protein n=1 Tax=Emticicia sp. TaxID=1930953 RepID=UPI003BA67DBD